MTSKPTTPNAHTPTPRPTRRGAVDPYRPVMLAECRFCGCEIIADAEKRAFQGRVGGVIGEVCQHFVAGQYCDPMPNQEGAGTWPHSRRIECSADIVHERIPPDLDDSWPTSIAKLCAALVDDGDDFQVARLSVPVQQSLEAAAANGEMCTDFVRSVVVLAADVELLAECLEAALTEAGTDDRDTDDDEAAE